MAISDYYSEVQKMYVAYYGRAADTTGLEYWAGRLNDLNGDKTAMIDAFGTSSESTTLYSGSSNEAIVNAIYQQQFGRDADVDGLTYYALQLANGTMTAASIALNVADGAQGGDADVITNKVSAATSFTNSLDTASEIVAYAGDDAAATARTWLSTVTSDAASVTTAEGNIDSTISSIETSSSTSSSAGTSYTLTSGSDSLSGTSGDDTFSGTLGSLGSTDEISGGAGTDSLTVTFAPSLATAGSATAAAPIISAVETLTITNRTDTATFNMVDVVGETAITLGGNNVLSVTNMDLTAATVAGMSSTLALDLATATASTATYGMTLDMSSSQSANLVFTEDAGLTAADTLALNVQTDYGNGLTGQLDVSGIESLSISGAGSANLNLASATWANNFKDLTAIDASGLSGNLTLSVDGAANLNIMGGAGADNITMTANFATNDSVAGGAGADVLNAKVSGYLRPGLSGIETLNLQADGSAVTADFRDATDVTTVNLLTTTAVSLTRAGSAMTTLAINSSDATANTFTVGYGTAAAASDVTLSLGNGAMSAFQTAAATASGMAIGTITMSANSGSLTIIANSTAAYTGSDLAMNDFTAITVNAASGSLSFDSANFNTAQTLSFMAGAGKTLAFNSGVTAVATNMTVSAAQSATVTFTGTVQLHGNTAGSVTIAADSSADVNFSAITMCGIDTLSIGAAAGASFTATEINMGQDGATAHSGALAMDTITLSGAGDISIAGLNATGGAMTAVSGISLNINAMMGSTAADYGLCALDLSDVGSAATANEQDVTFTLTGTGNFTLSAAATDSSNLTYHIDGSALASGSNVTIDLSSVNDTGSVASAVFGAHSGTYVGLDGVDMIELGLGAVTVNGGLGADQITLNNTATHRVDILSNVSAAAGTTTDTIVGIGSGDTILFSGAAVESGTKIGIGGITGAWSTGTATNTAQIATASYTAYAVDGIVATATKALSIYTSNGDTIIEILLATASAAGTGDYDLSAAIAGDGFQRVTLSNKDFTAITAAFNVNTTGSGLMITLL